MNSIEQLFEQITDEFNLDCVFEASNARSPILKKIDINFKEYKEKKISKKELQNLLSKNLKQFTKINKVDVVIRSKVFDACVFTIYKNNLPTIFKRVDEKIKVDKISVEESPKYIERIVISLGGQLIKFLDHRELTGIILHELGHIYQHTSNISIILPSLINKLTKASTIGSTVLFFKILFFSPVNSLYILPFVFSLFTLSRTLTFKEHRGELMADRYAAKYGYGDELAKVFYKFNKRFGNNEKMPSSWLSKMWNSIKEFFNFSTHPKDVKRVCELIRTVKNQYKNKYPKLKKEISIIYADIKC